MLLASLAREIASERRRPHQRPLASVAAVNLFAAAMWASAWSV
jgi:hypothetical protein